MASYQNPSGERTLCFPPGGFLVIAYFCFDPAGLDIACFCSDLAGLDSVA
jgi:hypothetical protein